MKLFFMLSIYKITVDISFFCLKYYSKFNQLIILIIYRPRRHFRTVLKVLKLYT